MADKDEAAASDPSSDADLPAELTESDASDSERVASDDLEPAELETAGVGVAAGAGSSAVARGSKTAPVPKGTPTAKRDVAETPGRTTPAAFVRQSVGELRKVVYPTGQQLGNYFLVVLVFVLFVIAFVSLLDLGIGKLIFAIFS
ncbi:preprotein translocase subunit SecE [Microlunatus flavus]|uniref:Protein translocase subunit SecE n=1 Tax=Microlunatus flavus TaxID=1036181 RepID=A0A1H9LSE2_9ACTN|nr:preprotein translocase subunit SecE [Microlunatus flavus]SER14391.1 preprotein translocase subunit SecE [Microlunatus flavus]